jgi:hypothetical protein
LQLIFALELSTLVSVKRIAIAKDQWLTPVILDTQEAKIRRIVVRSQPRQIVYETLC